MYPTQLEKKIHVNVNVGPKFEKLNEEWKIVGV
jgi:hypothetical protein